MTFTIRKASREDMASVLNLIEELAEFEKEPQEVELNISDLEQAGFGASPQFTCFVAEVNSVIVGLALVYYRFSTWKGRVLHLEDLIVRQKMRGSGLGTALLDAVVKYGNEQGVKRISWEVLDWNEPAITFYENKGADVKRDWDVVHLNEKAIQNYLSKL
ncbi:GNAT family N-acetyltransferase [Sediminibacter sp. Hel_I_10]|uniref:GNAT family N-acetyltransferase n=1 Tax=Sediminibacter sp. Hel_I_10 TaxID=1392490 RepID=UPI00047B5629|nr:GNAT family N-acetyltransferase [Sediminibacter sp. Hel_I_10]